jgi:hypothetical protein
MTFSTLYWQFGLERLEPQTALCSYKSAVKNELKIRRRPIKKNLDLYIQIC